MSHQKTRARLDTARPAELTPRDRRLIEQMIGIARLFTPAPAPSWAWYEVSREQPRTLAWRALFRDLDGAAGCAAAAGPDVQAAFRLRVGMLFDTMKADVLARLPGRPACVRTLNLRETALEGPWNLVQLRLQGDESEAALAEAEATCVAYLSVLTELLDAIQRKRREPEARRANAVRLA